MKSKRGGSRKTRPVIFPDHLLAGKCAHQLQRQVADTTWRTSATLTVR